MRFGMRLPTPESGAGLSAWARAIEDAGFASAWVSDHVLLPVQSNSRYPFSADGRVSWALDGEWFDPVVQLSVAAAATERLVLGTAVLVAPIRHPYIVARQFASLDRMYPGRFSLGIGAGWLAEEFAAMGVDFARRGALTLDWIHAVRTSWTGSVPAGVNASYPVPVPMHSLPTPAGEIEVLLGGTSPAAIRRAARYADAWMAHESLPTIDLQRVAQQADLLRAEAQGREVRIVLRIVGTADAAAEVAELLPVIAEAGVDEVVIDPPEHIERTTGEAHVLLGVELPLRKETNA